MNERAPEISDWDNETAVTEAKPEVHQGPESLRSYPSKSKHLTEETEVAQLRAELSRQRETEEEPARPSKERLATREIINQELLAQELELINSSAGHPGIIERIFDRITHGADAEITAAEIDANDAKRVNALRTKAKHQELNSEEKTELELREGGRLFGYKKEQKETEGDFHSFLGALEGQGDAYSEKYYLMNHIFGLQNDKMVTLNRKDALNPKDKRPSVYDGRVDDKVISAEEAQKLFEKYYPTARKRMEELKALKEEKEKKKYGEPINRAFYRWEHRIQDDL